MSSNISQYPLQPPESTHGSSAEHTTTAAPHKRVYQACIPCRRRKVKCDLGSVDNPGDPPCVRCRRESKECFFSATRRKRKLPGGGEDSVDGDEFEDDYVVRNGRKSLQGTGNDVRQHYIAESTQSDSYLDNGPPLTPGGHAGRTQPLRRPQQSSGSSHRGDRNSDDSNIQFENPEAQNVMRREMYGPHDALDLLYKAATDRYDHSVHFLKFANQFIVLVINEREVPVKHKLRQLTAMIVPVCYIEQIPALRATISDNVQCHRLTCAGM